MKSDAADHHDAPAELPTQVKALIATVVLRTRLRKAERADIERELAAHFRDGLASGKSVAQLIEAFGEPKVSAKNIRAGAIARRPPLDRALRHARIAVGWALVACIVLYAGSIGYLWLQAPVISFDPFERLKETLPNVADRDRAWPVYKQGLVAFDDVQSLLFWSTEQNLRSPEQKTFPTDPDWQTQRKALIQRRAAIDTLVGAAFMPALGYLPRNEPWKEDAEFFEGTTTTDGKRSALQGSLFSMRLNCVRPLSRAARLIAADSLMSAEDGDGARFVRDMEAMIRLSHQMREFNIVIAQLAGCEVLNLAFKQIIVVLEWRPQSLSDAQLKQLLALLQSLPDADYSLDLSLEKLSMQDLFQRLYTDNGRGDGWFNPVYASPIIKELFLPGTPADGAPSWGPNQRLMMLTNAMNAPLGAGVLASRKESLERYEVIMNQFEAQSKRPVRLQNCSLQWEFVKEMFEPRYFVSKWHLIDILTPAFSSAAQRCRLCESQCMAAQTAIALTLYRREHGTWPATLDEFTTLTESVPAYLRTAPLDPWTGAVVDYEVKDGRVRMWSTSSEPRGPDGYGQSSASEWINSPRNGTLAKWLWFSSDDRLERWKADSQPAR